MENRNSPTLFAITPNVSRPCMRCSRRILAAFLWLAAAGAAFSGSAAVTETDRTERARYGELLDLHARSGQPALRVMADTTRHRLWVLGPQDVFVYDTEAKQTLKRIALPVWSVAGIACPPAMALNAAGAAIVASNAEPRLWKIDADNFGIREHAIRLLGKELWDTGFSAITFTADGTLFALSSFAGSLWRIDIAQSSAGEIKLSERVLNACALHAPPRAADRPPSQGVTLCADTGKGTRRIDVSGEFSRAHVAQAQCNER